MTDKCEKSVNRGQSVGRVIGQDIPKSKISITKIPFLSKNELSLSFSDVLIIY